MTFGITAPETASNLFFHTNLQGDPIALPLVRRQQSVAWEEEQVPYVVWEERHRGDFTAKQNTEEI